MKLLLTLQRPSGSTDIAVTIDNDHTVGELATELATRDRQRGTGAGQNLTIRIEGPGPGRTLAQSLPIDSSGLRSGSHISLAPVGSAYSDERAPGDTAATLVVIEGPDVGRKFPLRLGSNQLGRGRANDVALTDPMVSKEHARINVTDVIEIVDLNSSNGVVVGGERSDRVVLRADDTALIGDSVVRVEHHGGASIAHPVVAFNRSPRLDPVYTGQEFDAPEPPQPPQRGRIPLAPLLIPLIMGPIMYTISGSWTAVIFLALSPLMMIGSFAEQIYSGKKAFEKATELFRVALSELAAALEQEVVIERTSRLRETPSSQDVLASADRRTSLLWTRRPAERGFLDIRMGLGRAPSRNVIKLAQLNGTTAELRSEVLEVAHRFEFVDGVPIIANLNEHGGFGVSGPREVAAAAVLSSLTQIVGMHSPAEVVVAAMASPATAAQWETLKWLPHCSSEHSPVRSEHLAWSPTAITKLAASFEEIIEARSQHSDSRQEPQTIPVCILLVDDDAGFDRRRVNMIAEAGPAVGVHVIWAAPNLERLPAACRAYVEFDPTTGKAQAGIITDQLAVSPLESEVVGSEAFASLGRGLAPVVDAGAAPVDEADLPRSVPFLEMVGIEAGSSNEWVLDRWRANRSIPGDPRNADRKANRDLSAIVGKLGHVDPMRLDLRADGPHALLGGTTGAGKSEFLQTWVASLALSYSPARITFLFVDYKGGAAFADCEKLPHCVGLVDDLNPHLVRRALTSLDAELKYREHLLQRKRAKDMLELEKKGDPDAAPSLVIVVDEFAALVAELPEFVDGVVNIAQRGRSLGLHLILATQRPKGVIKDNLRANTNLRVALRVADADDSSDVVGSAIAAGFDPSIPGRGVVKAGPGRLTSFQTGYVGGYSSQVVVRAPVLIDELRFGMGQSWDPIENTEANDSAPLGPTDLQRVIANVREVAQAHQLAEPRKPWLSPLASAYDLASGLISRVDSELVFGVVDDPENQQQTTVSFLPDRDGNMAVFGAGGSGKTVFLRTLAVSAGLSSRGGPCHVYAIDCGTRGLQILENLPHVGSVIFGDDDERIARLLRQLNDLIQVRATEFAKFNVATIDAYRQAANKPDEARVLLLLDGFATYRQNFEMSAPRLMDQLLQIMTDGRPVGVHVVLTADRGNTIPQSFAATVQRRLVLRLATENDYYGLGKVEADAFTDETPAGRGFIDGYEAQVYVLGGSSDVGVQASRIQELGAVLKERGAMKPAAAVERLTSRVSLSELPTRSANGLPVFGIEDDGLTPFGFDDQGPLLVVGPPKSGRSSTVAMLVQSLRRADPKRPCLLLGARSSSLDAAAEWTARGIGADDVAEIANHWASEVVTPDGGKLVVVIEAFTELAGSSADDALLALVKACNAAGATVIAESDVSNVTGGYAEFAALIRSSRHGIALQPDQMEGDAAFKTPFPRVSRASFPAGRGLYVALGRTTRVQCALPE